MEIFPFLSFPSVVTDITLGKLTPYELFTFSLHSEEARNIVKRFSNTRKFHMYINLNDDDELTFNYENEKKNDLVLSSYPQDEPTDHILKFDGLDENVFADIETNEERTTVELYFEKKERAERLQFVIEYMAKVFNNISISIRIGDKWLRREYSMRWHAKGEYTKMRKEHSTVVRIIKATIKKCNFNIRSYCDITYIHTFKELEQLISCKELDVSKCELTKEELKKLYDKWMEVPNPGKITLGYSKIFKIEDLSAGNAIVNEDIGYRNINQYFDVTRGDGTKARIELWCSRFIFKII